MVTVAYDRGVFLPQSGLWLDPWQAQDFAFVSHAHSDHTARHRRVFCTGPTARLMQVRMGGDFEVFETLPYRERKVFDGWAATLLPAGHILGSAQLFLESDEGTLLYTGDFKLRPGLSSEPAASDHAETLIMETTFGLPRYQFPPAAEVLAAMVKFCLEAIEDGETPVLLGYALGKAQEILAALNGAGLPVMLHGAVEKITRVYEEFGVTFPPYAAYDSANVRGHVLICPPGAKGSRMLAKIKPCRVAMLTGWALDAGAIHRRQVDAAFPLSDHAGYDDLLRQVEAVNPARVLTLHGFAREFASDLRERGIEAWALTGTNQLELSLCLPVAELSRPAAPAASPDNTGFNAFCLVSEAIRGTTGKLEKTRILSGYFQSLDDTALALAAVWLTGRAFARSDNRPHGAGSAVIRQALSAASGLSLPAWRIISRKHNDTGLTAAEAMSARPGREPFALPELDRIFQALRLARGPLLKSEILTAALIRLPALASGYLVRILTGDLRIGLKEGLVEEALAEAFAVEAGAFRDASMLMGDIGRAAVLARHDRLAEAELTLFQPVKCMLAGPEPDAESLWSRLGHAGAVWLEDKLDGIRAQIHCGAGRAEIFSRDLKLITATFPEIAAAALRFGEDAVFDGEILAWENGRALSFFELQKRLGRRDPDLFLGGEIPVACVIFDLLRLQGESLLKLPLSARRARLEALGLPAPLRIMPIATAANAGEIESCFKAARASGNEGVMAKDPASIYTPGRRGLAWVKFKKDFATLDVAVVAVAYGHGRRSKVLSDYTLAVRDGISGALLPIGKAYSGLTDAEIAQLTPEFLALAQSRKGNRIEVEPRVIIEVAFDAIQPSGRHASGLALRFPRIKRLRPDKTVQDIDTLAAARRLAGVTDRSP